MKIEKKNQVEKIIIKYNDGTEKQIEKGVVITDSVNIAEDHSLLFEFANVEGKEVVTIITGIMMMAKELGIREELEEQEAIKFLDNDHKVSYERFITEDKTEKWDSERKSLFYLLALNEDTRKNIRLLYDFKNRCIDVKGLELGFQTSSSSAITRLAFNLYNGFKRTLEESEKGTECKVTPIDCFVYPSKNKYLFEAIRIRNE